MLTFFRKVSFLFLAAMPVYAGSEAFCVEPVSGNDEVLLLKNEQLLRGKITQHGDHYQITLSNGEIRVPVADVQFVAGSVQEAYLQRRHAIRFGDAADHLQLARWCLDQKMLDPAAREIEAARALAPTHRQLTSLARQVEIARTPKPRQPLRTAVAQNSQLATELETLARGMPRGSVQSFTKNIQPLLVNGCAASACHGPSAKNDFRLMRTPRGKLPPRRVTQRNLHAVMQWINYDEPAASRLLLAAIEPHGPQKSAVLRREGIPYRNLAAWLSYVSQAGKQNLPSAVEEEGTQTLSQAISIEPTRARAATQPSKLLRDMMRSKREVDSQKQDRPNAEQSTKSARSRSGSLPSRDPFDPDVFNRRFHQDQR